MAHEYPTELLKVVRATAQLAEIYWHEDCFPKEFKSAERGWLPALVQFTAGYAYERQGAAPAYRGLARTALANVGGDLSTPTSALPKDVWQEFVRLAKAAGVLPNWKVNPLAWRKDSSKVSSVQFVLALKSDSHNILK